MTMARKQLVDVEMTRYYHCISRCVRRAFLCGAGFEHRKDWIESRLRELAGIFSLDVCGFAVMDNHLHVLLRLNPSLSAGWSAEDIVRRWAKLFPPRDKTGKVLPVGAGWIEARREDAAWFTKARQRLCDLGWFMKSLKEPLAKMANREDHWLCPIENRSRRGAKRIGMLEGLSLTGYLKLLDWSSRLLRSEKKSVSRVAAPLLERLRIDADSWEATLRRFFSGHKLVGNFFGHISRLQAAASMRSRQWLKDIGGRSLIASPPPIG